MYRQAVIAAGGGAISVMLFVGVLGGGGGVIFGYFSPLPLLMVGLNGGIRNAATATLVGLILAVVITSNGLVAAIYGGVIVLPCWLVLRYALLSRIDQQGNVTWYPAGSVLCYLAGLGTAFMLLTAIVHLDAEDGFQGAVRSYVDHFLELRFRALISGIDRAPVVERFVPLFPGTAVASWLFMLAVNVVLAQGILVRIGRNLRPTPVYSRITIPEWLYWASVAAALSALFGSGDVEYVARNLVIVFATPFFFVGLGIIHLMIRRLSLPGIALTVFYMFLLFLGWPAVAVASLGFVEEWADLRKKYGPPDTQELGEEE